MSWTAGYNNSVAYTTGYYQEQSPTYLNACLAMQRVAPPSIEKFTYCELGFGQGLTSLILAATHPQGDFSPATSIRCMCWPRHQYATKRSYRTSPCWKTVSVNWRRARSSFPCSTTSQCTVSSRGYRMKLARRSCSS